MMFMTGYAAVFWITAVIECRPARFIFDKSGIQGHCFPGYFIKGMKNTHAGEFSSFVLEVEEMLMDVVVEQ